MAEPQNAENVLGDERRESFTFKGCLDFFGQSREHQGRIVTHYLGLLTSSVFWKGPIVFFTIVLLFGSPIQFLWTTKEWDLMFDSLYIAGLVTFVLDFVFNMIVHPEYLGLGMCRRNQVQQSDHISIFRYGIGSFEMWCDLVSTAALLYDISYFNGDEYDMETLTVQVNSLGIPTNFGKVNSRHPVEVRTGSMVLVCKAARVARLIPSTKVVEITSRVNFYWYVERLNPFWYWRNICNFLERVKKSKEEMEPNRNSGMFRRTSWGGIEIPSLQAAAKALQARKKQEETGALQKALERLKSGLRSAGILPNSTFELKRNTAAEKIQRAWRRSHARATEARSMDDAMGDDGWRSRAAGTTFDRAIKSRAMLGPYHKQNGRNIRNRAGAPKQDNVNPTMRDPSARANSQVGSAMADVTGQWVATVTLLCLLMTFLFSYHERDATMASTMVVLHGQVLQSPNEAIAYKAVNTSFSSVIPDLFEFESNVDGDGYNFTFEPSHDLSSLRDREMLQIRVEVEGTNQKSQGMFVNRHEKKDQALVELLTTIFVLLVWFLGVTSFAGPVMTLVIIPVERMVRLLGMLMADPLCFQTNIGFKKFLYEEDALAKKSQWTKEALKGMETSFLMSTILRIGSLMKVGFGSAGVEIIRNHLQGQNNMLILNAQGSTVSCVFLFCDIRQFTDATECLQEEVFVFTNRIAAVVHSICHSYGGSANKNVGDAFLVSWLLDDEAAGSAPRFNSRSSHSLVAKHNQADKALLSVVKISMALHYDEYYVETMTDIAKTALLDKVKSRTGPVVQMGFGLHAGKAVQGAIGSQRKIDATYVSEAVERAEFLESSTKKYGIKMLMSDNFHSLLHQSNRRRCRKIDQIVFANEDEDYDEPDYAEGDIMELYTYDMDIDALWKSKRASRPGENRDHTAETDHAKANQPRQRPRRQRRMSMRAYTGKRDAGTDEPKSSSITPGTEAGAKVAEAASAAAEIAGNTFFDGEGLDEAVEPGELVLPTGPALYNQNVWLQEDMRRIRHQYTSLVFQTFNSGLQKYYGRDWNGARKCFEDIMAEFEDGPSKYFLAEMERHNWKPPPRFQAFGWA